MFIIKSSLFLFYYEFVLVGQQLIR